MCTIIYRRSTIQQKQLAIDQTKWINEQKQSRIVCLTNSMENWNIKPPYNLQVISPSIVVFPQQKRQSIKPGPSLHQLITVVDPEEYMLWVRRIVFPANKDCVICCTKATHRRKVNRACKKDLGVCSCCFCCRLLVSLAVNKPRTWSPFTKKLDYR